MIATSAFSVKDRAGRVENIIAIFQTGSQSFQAGAFSGPRSPEAWEWRALPVIAETTHGCRSVLESYVTEYCPEYHLVERDTPYWTPAECGAAILLYRGFSDSPKPRHNVPGETESNQAQWYAENPRVAEYFANGVRTPPGVLYPGSHVEETDVALKNPLIVDMADPAYRPTDQRAKSWQDTARDSGRTVAEIGFVKERTLRQARKNGNDGVIFLNGYDGRPYSGRIVAVLKPSESPAQQPPAAPPSEPPAAPQRVGGLIGELVERRRKIRRMLLDTIARSPARFTGWAV